MKYNIFGTESGRYDDIIGMKHHVSERHQHMSMHDRAAQFAPFAALTGHGAAIEETARLTDARLELDESRKTALDHVLSDIMESGRQERVCIEYFIQDEKKSGGRYEKIYGIISKVDTYRKRIVMKDGVELPVDDVVDIVCDRS